MSKFWNEESEREESERREAAYREGDPRRTCGFEMYSADWQQRALLGAMLDSLYRIEDALTSQPGTKGSAP